jgi:hypothetical protein
VIVDDQGVTRNRTAEENTRLHLADPAHREYRAFMLFCEQTARSKVGMTIQDSWDTVPDDQRWIHKHLARSEHPDAAERKAEDKRQVIRWGSLMRRCWLAGAHGIGPVLGHRMFWRTQPGSVRHVYYIDMTALPRTSEDQHEPTYAIALDPVPTEPEAELAPLMNFLDPASIKTGHHGWVSFDASSLEMYVPRFINTEHGRYEIRRVPQ